MTLGIIMLNKRLIYIVIFMIITINIVDANDSKERIYIEFIGYESQIPIFNSTVYKNNEKKEYNGYVYKYDYAYDQLVKMDIFLTQNQTLVLVKDSIYVIREVLENSTIFHFKLNGKNLISQLIVESRISSSRTVVLNEERVFILLKSDENEGSKILQAKYRNPVETDTININGYCVNLLDATNDYLYYTTQNSEIIGPEGYVYEVELKSHSAKKILGNTSIMDEYVTIIPDKGLIFDVILFDGKFRPLITFYNLKLYVISPETVGRYIFYSYGRDAFVVYNRSTEVESWIRFNYTNLDALDWKSFVNPLLRPDPRKEKATGPRSVPFTKH